MQTRSGNTQRTLRGGFSFYETAAKAVIATTTLAATAQSAIVYVNGANLTSTGDITPAGGSTAGFEIGSQFSSSAFGYVVGIGNLAIASGSLGGVFRNGGAEAGPSGQFFASSVNFIASSNFAQNAQSGSDNYFAFTFTTNDVNGGNPVYGWGQLDLTDGDSPDQARIVAWAYDDSGAAITLGAVPEPSGLALLALGAVGATAFHRRRRRIDTVAAE